MRVGLQCHDSKIFLNRTAMGPTLNGAYREAVGLVVRIKLWAILWDPNKAIDIRRWMIYVGGRLERFYYIYIYLYIYMEQETCLRQFMK